eukprot:GDKH01003116.1.p1 GENE.GDKH01003116.1~~GDKH01003116.1.p1  ORF type:complete len:101 (+),score=5.66 GDKH01003116.1:119-421(+)
MPPVKRKARKFNKEGPSFTDAKRTKIAEKIGSLAIYMRKNNSCFVDPELPALEPPLVRRMWKTSVHFCSDHVIPDEAQGPSGCKVGQLGVKAKSEGDGLP